MDQKSFPTVSEVVAKYTIVTSMAMSICDVISKSL
jgi:hypothetical protein